MGHGCCAATAMTGDNDNNNEEEEEEDKNRGTNFKDVINFNRLPLFVRIQLVFKGMQEMCQGSCECVASLWVTLSRHVGVACWRSGYAERVTLTKKITESFTGNPTFFFQQRHKKWQRYQTSGASALKKTEFV
jgi:hypothetical protein